MVTISRIRVRYINGRRSFAVASMKDVAKMADVSISTVSRVISGTTPVDPKTRKRVEQAVQATGFKPNLIARGLRVKSASLVGMLVPEIRTTSFSILIEHVETAVEALGYNLILGGTGGDPDREERFFENLVRRHIDGVIVSLVSDHSHLMHLIERTDVPVVIIDRPLKHYAFPTVVMDNRLAGKMAAEHLLSLGHKKFACITGGSDIGISRDRLDGFRDALADAGILLESKAVVDGNFQYESGYRCIDALLSNGAAFTALWAQNDIMAIGALNRLREHGISVPGDVSIMGVDNVDDAWMARPAITTIAQPYKEIAQVAARLLHSINRGETLEEKWLTLAPELVVRESTGIAS